MSPSGRRRAVVPFLALLVAFTAGCGSSAEEEAAALAAADRAYAAAVTTVTQRTTARLSEISTQSDYRDADAAAQSTRAYATSIRTAVTDLERTKPPADVAPAHRELVALYRATADRMNDLATSFATARGQRALAQQAQELSGEVQAYSTKEAQLRRAIERALAPARTPKTR